MRYREKDEYIFQQLQQVKVVPLKWGEFSPEVINISTPDIILGADLFYDPSDFDDILASVTLFIEDNPAAIFLITYQERSSNRSIEYLLEKWKLKSRMIKLSEFLTDELMEKAETNSIFMVEISRKEK